jgi:CRISPR-associated protein Csx3
MANLLPAILFGGPPHAGKSVLIYSLSQALRKRNIDHYAIRANPDGEGDWSQEIAKDAFDVIRHKGDWTPEFVKSICRDLEGRQLPFLVDVGGRPEEWQRCIFNQCTHSVLLLHSHNEHTIQFWQQLVETSNLVPLAVLYSKFEGNSTITSTEPIIEGTLTGLERQTLAQGSLFDTLVEHVATLFTTHFTEEMKQAHLGAAQAKAVDLNAFIQIWDPQSKHWKPEMLIPLLSTLPHSAPLAVYGRGTNWLYGTLAAYCSDEAFYQFDSRLGWVVPPAIQIGMPAHPEVSVQLRPHEDITVLSVHIANDHFDYAQAEQLLFPPLPPEQGLILNGKMPLWLTTALVRLYLRMDIPWIACHQPQLKGAVVVASHIANRSPGDLIPLPIG